MVIKWNLSSSAARWVQLIKAPKSTHWSSIRPLRQHQYLKSLQTQLMQLMQRIRKSRGRKHRISLRYKTLSVVGWVQMLVASVRRRQDTEIDSQMLSVISFTWSTAAYLPVASKQFARPNSLPTCLPLLSRRSASPKARSSTTWTSVTQCDTITMAATRKACGQLSTRKLA